MSSLDSRLHGNDKQLTYSLKKQIKMKQTVKTFKALGDPTRLRIVKLLENGELCVCQLMEALKMGQSRISRHLSILKEAGLIEDRRQGKWVHYRLQKNKTNKKYLSLLNEMVSICKW